MLLIIQESRTCLLSYNFNYLETCELRYVLIDIELIL